MQRWYFVYFLCVWTVSGFLSFFIKILLVVTWLFAAKVNFRTSLTNLLSRCNLNVSSSASYMCRQKLSTSRADIFQRYISSEYEALIYFVKMLIEAHLIPVCTGTRDRPDQRFRREELYGPMINYAQH